MSGIRLLFHTSIAVVWALSLVACHKQESAGDTHASSTEEAVPYYNTPDFTPVWLSDPADVNAKITHRTGDFSFRDQTNTLVTQQALANKIHVANFFFTACPTICPKMTNLLRAVQDTFRHEPRVALLSFSVTPWLDSIPRLRKYAAEKGVIANKWHLLTGDRGKLYTLARQSYFAEETIGFTKDSTEFLHTEHIILVDQNRRIRGVYNGTLPLAIDQLITDIKLLLGEI
ncbi:SCO family protein [Spirosoma sp.]|uniref:SCO family protein n=1 Tax=Spirosoma sp. TaxID=1899569 RepID=UPI0026122F62|nr:SCO family protein [Spirosoma sp.]MCX6214487.1 SCO family protein [Spirosoma sp.]